MPTLQSNPARHCLPRTMTFLFILRILLLALAATVPLRSRAAGTWLALTNPAPGGVNLMLLLSDGTVMTAGSGTSWYRLTPDVHGSYVNGTWTTLAPMNDSRRYFSSQVLPDGRVFVAGGEYGSGANKAEIYQPRTTLGRRRPRRRTPSLTMFPRHCPPATFWKAVRAVTSASTTSSPIHGRLRLCRWAARMNHHGSNCRTAVF